MKEIDNILLKRLLKKPINPTTSEIDKIIGFYKTILELEGSKEPDISTYYSYEMHFKNDDRDVILIDLPCNQNFTKVFFDNIDQTFPKDLYVGLPLIRKDKTGDIIAFSMTIAYDDLKGYDPYENLLPVRISNLSLDSRHIDQLELTEDKISEIESELGLVKNIHELENLVKNHFGENVELKNELRLGLSSKNLALAQISSELKKLNSSMVAKNDLLKKFLLHESFPNLIENISSEELIPVSKLDDSQASVVAHALGNRFTVVTGAPGTGKTQVILNIIANALLKDKSVLVASKNNKAVDNVKERFDIIDSSNYLLRFGKKENIIRQTLPALDQIKNRLEALKAQPNNLSDLLSQYKDNTAIIQNAKNKLSRIEELKVSIPKLLFEKTQIEKQIKEEQKRFSYISDGINNKYVDVSHLPNIDNESLSKTTSKITRLRNSYQRKYSGFGKTWHNLFSKKKHAETYLNNIEELSSSIKSELRERNLKRSIDEFKDGNSIIENAKQIIGLLERIIDWQRNLDKESSAHSSAISKLNVKLGVINQKYNKSAEELEELSKRKTDLIYSIRQAKDILNNLGPQLVAAKIIEIEKGQNTSQKISSYKAYLPDRIPWKDNEVRTFIQRSRDFLTVCRLISVTSLSVKAGFPLSDNLFDILIIDEASQCDVASAIPLILRAKQVVIIGDPMQLKHITSVRTEEENEIREHYLLSSRPYLKYVEQSLWDYSADFLGHATQNSFPIALENHYRCHPDIIGYSNNQFYSRSLDKPLNVLTDVSKMSLPQQGMVLINVRGKQESENVNLNKVEADRVISLAKEVLSLKSDASIGIVTPFRDQADYIKSHLEDSLKENVEVNTAHGFQGDEKDVIIYSLVITDNSPKRKVNWIDYMTPNLVNVAVTRARQTLYIVGNAEYIKSVSPERNALGYLIRYAQSKK